MATQSKFQSTYAKAKTAYETAKNGYDAELISTGLRARIDAATTDEEFDALELEDAPLFAKWNVSKLEKALTRAENALIDWSLDIAIAMKPNSRIEIESLRDTMKSKTRHDTHKAEAIRLAMTLPG